MGGMGEGGGHEVLYAAVLSLGPSPLLHTQEQWPRFLLPTKNRQGTGCVIHVHVHTSVAVIPHQSSPTAHCVSPPSPSLPTAHCVSPPPPPHGSLYVLPHSPQHHKKTRHFWWFHGAEQNQLQTFLLFSAEYKRSVSQYGNETSESPLEFQNETSEPPVLV